MEKVKIYYQPEVENYINELMYTLYSENYFGFLESAVTYKNKIIDFIETKIAIFPFKNTPFRLRNLGSKYIFHKINDNTTWYIFFEKKDKTYLITYITNNHDQLIRFL